MITLVRGVAGAVIAFLAAETWADRGTSIVIALIGAAAVVVAARMAAGRSTKPLEVSLGEHRDHVDERLDAQDRSIDDLKRNVAAQGGQIIAMSEAIDDIRDQQEGT